jgi:predicted nucleic acid-binding protein
MALIYARACRRTDLGSGQCPMPGGLGANSVTRERSAHLTNRPVSARYRRGAPKEAAHTWFAASRSYRWATCPLTENAFVRVLSNPAYPGQATTVEDAVSRLRTFCSEREHVFWPDSVSIREHGRLRWNHVQGHRQLTECLFVGLSAVEPGPLGDLRLHNFAQGDRRGEGTES